jgi:hypothetical protein
MDVMAHQKVPPESRPAAFRKTPGSTRCLLDARSCPQLMETNSTAIEPTLSFFIFKPSADRQNGP